jgi:hypothetical protein
MDFFLMLYFISSSIYGFLMKILWMMHQAMRKEQDLIVFFFQNKVSSMFASLGLPHSESLRNSVIAKTLQDLRGLF